MTVFFIGAGPGDPELITVRGLRLIERCPVCLYAGSLVPEEIVAAAPPSTRTRSQLSPIDGPSSALFSSLALIGRNFCNGFLWLPTAGR